MLQGKNEVLYYVVLYITHRFYCLNDFFVHKQIKKNLQSTY